MQRERISDSVYVFTSELYVQVTAGVILTSEGAVLVDTLLYPEETLQMKHFIEDRLGAHVRYVINTHHHADHTMGTCFFPGARVIAHRLCYDLLDTRVRESLARTQSTSSDFADVEIVLPHILFEDRMTLHLGNRTISLWHSPGHSLDSLVCAIEEEQILFAADTVMPIPHFVNGHYEAILASIEVLRGRNYDIIIQGHGEVILRGEIESRLQEDVEYLRKLHSAVDRAVSTTPNPARLSKALEGIKIEACGKSKILLNGAAQTLHRQNVLALAQQRRQTLYPTDQLLEETDGR
jgi:glyoxylase-like metal-dependent hydrolase (beta-lactamase superfamily II)